ncbi:hypothetical protein [Streptomyces adelaidensis]|uniref:hypothetical protein n=1 Tax=Streptomyces adelaidensis TaxID=2796465 RepID=UPI0035589EF1
MAVSGSRTRDLLDRQLSAALALRPDIASVVIGVNDTLRRTFDIHAVAARLDQVYGGVPGAGRGAAHRVPVRPRDDARPARGVRQAARPAAARRQHRRARPVRASRGRPSARLGRGLADGPRDVERGPAAPR